MEPDSEGTLRVLVAGLCVDILTGKHLHYDRLPDCVIDLAFIIVENAVGLVRKFGFVVSGLCDDDWALVLLLDLLLL